MMHTSSNIPPTVVWREILKVSLTLRVQQSGDAQVSLCHAEGLLQILLVALSVHLAHVDQSGPAAGESREWKRLKMTPLLLSIKTES